MKTTVKPIFAVPFFALALTISCKGKKEDETVKPDLPGKGETFYYAETRQAEGVEGTSYHFVQLVREKDDAVLGMEISAPYGTDGMRGSFKGVLDTVNDLVQTELSFLAEGERIAQSRDYKVLDTSLAYVREDRSVDLNTAIPRVSAEGYERMFKEFQQQMLKNAVNTADRSRLMKVQEIRSNFSADEMKEVRFVERYVNLDNDFATEEYLLILLDPMYCGSGGCTLFVIDGEGGLRSRTTVADMPVYTPILSRSEMTERQGKWNDLYVWSKGLRRLQADSEGVYTSNASMAEEVTEDLLKRQPERYQLVLDFIEQP